MNTEIRITEIKNVSRKDNVRHIPLDNSPLEFHKTLEGYEPTPLVDLKGLARKLGLKNILVKDESKRFGLNAFKSLGGSFAMHTLLGDSREKKTFITTTDGNHGRGVAWAAKVLGQEAYVYMPVGTVPERLENIKKLGAHAEITDMQYDDCVRYTAKLSKDNDWILIQDTSWDGYEDIPALIMQGYTTMGHEIMEQLKEIKPTHIFLQAGVGSMAAAVAQFFCQKVEPKPVVVIVEPTGADCIYKTAKAADGRCHFAYDLKSIMAGLCCGEPCTLAWDLIEKYGDFAIACDDEVTKTGMRALGKPVSGDPCIISGESGAVTTGLVVELMGNELYSDIRKQLKLDKESVVLCISTEGDTDKENYKRILMD